MEKNIKKLLPYFIVGGSFLITYLISYFLLSDVYVFSWAYQNSYWYVWVVALLLVLFKKEIVAYSIAIGNVVGLIGGHILDKIFLPIRMAGITEDMSKGQVYTRSQPQAAFYWMGIVLLFIVAGSILTWVRNKRNS